MTRSKCSTCVNYQPKEEKSLCDDCARDYFKEDCGSRAIHAINGNNVIECKESIPKRCGNCGWHGRHDNWSDQAPCLYDGTFSLNSFKAVVDGFRCSWKPICEKCGGTGEVCKNGHHQRKACLGSWTPIPCPACTEGRPKRKLVEVRWVDMKGYNSWYLNPAR